MSIGNTITENCKETERFSSYLKYAILNVTEICLKIGSYLNDNGHMTSQFSMYT